MKKFIFMAIMFVMSIMAFSQNANTTGTKSTYVAPATTVKTITPTVAGNESQYAGYLCNPPLPYKPLKLNILFIGNSFSIDTATGAREILKNMNIRNVNIYVLYRGGCSLKEHYQYFKSGEKPYEFWHYNFEKAEMTDKSISIRDAMRRYEYDIVIFQQYSLESGEFTSYEPYLSKLITGYKMISISPRTTFAWNMTWAYSSKHKNISMYGSQEKMYKAICTSTKRMKAESGINVIIPCGTAVQNARRMKSLITKNEFTRDNQHMDYYMGRYLVGCTFFEAIIAPTLEKNLRDGTTIFGKDGEPNQVNGNNRDLLKKCARLAVANNYAVSEWVNEN